jgi:WD40 repeat protein
VISAGGDLRLRTWDAATGRQLREWRTSNSFYYHFGVQRPPLDISSDGRSFLIADSPEENDGGFLIANLFARRSMHENGIVVRDLETGQPIKRFPMELGRPSTGLSFVNGDRMVAAATLGGPIQLWDRSTGAKLRAVGEAASQITDFAFSPDGSLLACAGFARPAATVTVYDVATGKTQALRIDGGIYLMMFVTNDKLLISVQDFTNPRRVSVEVWDARQGTRLWKLVDHQSPVMAAALSHDGKKIATASVSDGIRLWDSRTGKELRRLVTRMQSIQAITFSFDDSRLATGTDRGLVQQWDANTGRQIGPDTVPGSPVHSTLFLADGARLVTAEQHGLVRMWRVADGQELRRLLPDSDTQADVGLAMDGQRLLTYGAARQWWDPVSGRLESAMAPPPIGPTYSEVISSDHRAELRASDKSAVLWDRRFNKELCPISVSSLMNAQMDFQGMTLSPDGQWLASRTMTMPNMVMVRGQLTEREQGTVIVYNTSNGQEARRLSAPVMGRTAMAFSPDDRLLAMTAGKEIRIYEMQTGAVRSHVSAAVSDESVLRFSGKGRLLAWGGPDGSVGVVDIWSPSSSWTSAGHRGGVQSLAFAGERYLASGSADTTAIVWDLAGLATDRTPGRQVPGIDLWRQLSDENAAKAFEAQRWLLERSGDPVALLRRHLGPAVPADAALLSRLIKGLDHDRYDVRERSRTELEKLGDRAAPAIMQAMQKPASLEAARLLHEIQNKLSAEGVPSDVAASRAIEVLEHLNTADAHQLLEELAAGMPEARITKEAKRSLVRMRTGEGEG